MHICFCRITKKRAFWLQCPSLRIHMRSRIQSMPCVMTALSCLKRDTQRTRPALTPHTAVVPSGAKKHAVVDVVERGCTCVDLDPRKPQNRVLDTLLRTDRSRLDLSTSCVSDLLHLDSFCAFMVKSISSDLACRLKARFLCPNFAHLSRVPPCLRPTITILHSTRLSRV